MSESALRRAWRIQRAGSLDRLQLVTEPTPDPGPEEVRVDVEAVGLNFADIFATLGLYSATPKGAFVPGLEFAGTVGAVGRNVDGFVPGQPVFGLTRFGAYATRVVVPAPYLTALPPGWSAAHGAAYPAQALTAWYAIRELAAVKPGATVLVQSAAGGVGLHALWLLKALGATAVAVVGTPAKRELLADAYGLAASRVIVRDRRGFPAQLDAALAAAGARGFDVVLDAVAGPFFDPQYQRLAPSGRYVIYGAADMMPAGRRPNWLRLAAQYLARPRVDPLAMITENRSVMGFNLIWLWDRADLLPAAYADLARFGPPPPHVGHRFAFEEAPAALQLLQSGSTVGKVVLDVLR